jgi:hypothetical protein
MHTVEILWLISWPVLIYISYRLVLVALKKFEKNAAKAEE